MTVFSPMASIHWGEDGHGQVSFCVCSTSTFSFSIFALHLGISRTLNSQSSQVSDPSRGISKIRVFLRLWVFDTVYFGFQFLDKGQQMLMTSLKILVVLVNVTEECFLTVVPF